MQATGLRRHLQSKEKDSRIPFKKHKSISMDGHDLGCTGRLAGGGCRMTGSLRGGRRKRSRVQEHVRYVNLMLIGGPTQAYRIGKKSINDF